MSLVYNCWQNVYFDWITACTPYPQTSYE